MRVHAVPSSGFCRTYVITGREGLMVVDVGSVGAVEDLARFIRNSLGRSLEAVRGAIVTHYHIDHIGGLGALLRACPDKAFVLFHRNVAAYLSGDRRLPPMKNWLTGLVPAFIGSLRDVSRVAHLHVESLAGIPLPGIRRWRKAPCPPSRIRFPDDRGRMRYPLGFDDWEVLETPGHTEDSISLYHEDARELICGDLILNFEPDGRGRLNRFCQDEAKVMKSFQILLEMTAPRRICPGHGHVIQGEGNVLRNVAQP